MENDKGLNEEIYANRELGWITLREFRDKFPERFYAVDYPLHPNYLEYCKKHYITPKPKPF